MGRKPYKNMNLPPRMRKQVKGKSTFYFYDHGNEIINGETKRLTTSLGKDFPMAIKKYAELEINIRDKGMGVITFKYVANNYIRDVIPTKALQTQKDNLKEISNLIEFFNTPPCPIEEITPTQVQEFMEWRVKRAQKTSTKFDPKRGQIRANREKALLSHIWTYAERKGYIRLPNPCRVIPGYKEKLRDVYIEDDDFLSVWYAADDSMRDVLDLLYCTAQRVTDVIEISENDVKASVVKITQNKTGKKLDIEITPTFRSVLERIARRKAGYKVRSLKLLVNDEGKSLTYFAIRKRFDNLRKKTGAKFQLRDIRAKAITDKENKTDLLTARKLAGHSKTSMTEYYIRNRKGESVRPTE